MFNATDVLIHWQPIVGRGRVQHALVVIGAAEPCVVPGGLHERIKGVGFQRRRLAVELRLAPLRVGLDGRLDTVHFHIFRQTYRQLVIGHRHLCAIFQGHHRDRCTPVTLAGYAPVAQAVVDGALADILFFQVAGNLVEGFLAGQAAVFARRHQRAFFGKRFFLHINLAAIAGSNNLLDGQLVFAGKLMVPLVVARNRHQGTGAVVSQHEVGDPDRDLFLSQRVNRLETGVDAALFHGGQLGLRGLAVSALLDKLSHVPMALRRLFRQRMLCGHGHVAHPHQGVGARGVNGQATVPVFQREGQLGTFRLADPVALHGLDLLRPVFQLVQIVQQLFGVIGNADKPLGNLLLFHQGPGTPAPAVDYLLVGQNRLIHRIPVHRGHFLVHQALFVQAGEEPLLPTVIIRLAGSQLPVPVVTKAQLLELVLHIFDVGVGPLGRRGLVGNGGVLSGQAESIPAHGLHYVLALHALVAGNHIADGVVTDMPHV